MIDMQVRTEQGEILARGARGFDWSQELIDLDPSAYPMLSGLCAFLDTMFNERQLPLLIDELDRLPSGIALHDESRAEIRRLCEVARMEPHRYLWFLGD
ncbi:hypothetical protein ABZ541_13280 [Micromonospora sediminicola]|uniref:hypothetical protein n=1 Tax=Micromonospora sediminicola TaxID=946078 RepID=UPI0033C9B244